VLTLRGCDIAPTEVIDPLLLLRLVAPPSAPTVSVSLLCTPRVDDEPDPAGNDAVPALDTWRVEPPPDDAAAGWLPIAAATSENATRP
jgi:hypothetical protein